MYEKIVFNLGSPKITYETLEGRKHLVVPAVMITEGVHEGTDGPLFYGEPVLSPTPQLWNHKPIVLEHPQKEGKGVTASDPIIINTQKIGIVLDTGWKDGKESFKAYIDEERLKELAPDILINLEKGQKIEVSTGIYAEHDNTPGEWNGEKFDASITGIKPDHLAILMNGEGACSIKDGCGCLVGNKGKLEPILNKGKAVPEGPSHKDIRENVHKALAEHYSGDPNDYWGGYIEDMFPKHVVYSRRQGNKEKMYSHEYSLNDDGSAELGKGPTEVKRVTEYRKKDDGSVVGNISSSTPSGGFNNLRSAEMAKKELVDKLIGNGYEEKDRTFLTSLSDEQIANIKPIPKAVVPEPAPTNNTGTITDEEFLKRLSPGSKLSAVLNRGMAVEEKERADCIAVITNNKNNTYTKEWLQEQSSEHLAAMAKLAGGSAKPLANYGGAASPFMVEVSQTQNAAPKKSLSLPKWDAVAAK